MRYVPCLLVLAAATTASAESRPREFLPEAKVLLVVGACAEGTPPAEIKPAIVDAHCNVLKKSQDEYKTGWIAKANAFFASVVPKTVPKIVVYPFAGGDLSTALTVYPDADEITRCHSSPPAIRSTSAGWPSPSSLAGSLATVDRELGSLLPVELFGVAMNMIGAMRGSGELRHAADLQLLVGAVAPRLRAELVALLQADPRRRHHLR